MDNTLEEQAIQQIMDSAYGGNQEPQVQEIVEEQAPGTQIQEPAPQEVVAQQEQTPAPASNQVPVPTPEMLALMQSNQGLQESINSIKQQIEQSNKPQLSDEEEALNELKAKLGFQEVTQQNEMLKTQLEQLQQTMLQQQLQSEVAQFKSERPNADETAIMEYMSKLPPETQRALDNPQGWRMIDDVISSRSQPQSQPDPIVPSQNTQNTQPTDTFNKVQKGEKVSDLDLGDALLSAAGFNS